MKLKGYFLFLIQLYVLQNITAQDSTFKNKEEDVIITATRIPTKMVNIAVPVLNINKNAILQTGALKLNEVFQEQTGVFITNGSGSRSVGGGVFGNGLQLQGMSPEHTLILIDGEPVNGRQGGILDLSRIAVGNIKNIEVIKGPFSSLYGSEAMGGVINIITENPKTNTSEAILRFGSFQTVEAQLKSFIKKNNWSTYLFANAFTSKGFDLNKNDVEKTVDPFHNATLQAKITYDINEHSSIQLNSRFFYGVQHSNFAINANYINIEGNAKTIDYANSLRYAFRLHKKIDASINLYHNHYQYDQTLDSIANKKNYYKDNFTQNFLRVENIANIRWNKDVTTVLGYGYTFQNVATIRYAGTKQQNAFHLFTQNEWKLLHKINLSTGVRFDYNTAFDYSINPKLAASYKASKKLRFNVSVGSGFKAPDFRQLYLSYINSAADNYVIYGTEEFSLSNLQEQKNAGLIADILPTANLIKSLVPEQNIGLNAGLQFTNNRNFKADINLFKNDVINLIQYIEVAKRFNGASVFSYVNINNAQTKGVETNVEVKLNQHFDIQGGYQYLLSADNDILQKVKEGKVFGRDRVGGSARVMNRGDYYGLQFRSKHMANFKILYHYKDFSTALRFLYRNKWGVIDLDGNGFANMPEEFASNFLQVNYSASQKIKKQWNVQVGMNNMLNYRDAKNITNIPGRNYFVTVHYKLNNNK